MLGLWPLPEKTPLKATITGTLERDGYVVDKLHDPDKPGLYVTANFIGRLKTASPARNIPVVPLCLRAFEMGCDGSKTAYQSHPIWLAKMASFASSSIRSIRRNQRLPPASFTTEHREHTRNSNMAPINQKQAAGVFVCGCNGGSGCCCSKCATERRSDPGKTSRSLHARPWIVSMTFTETSETRWLRPSRSETLIFTTVGFGCVSSHHIQAVVRRDTPQSEAPLTSESNSAAQTNGGLRNAGFDQAASDRRLPSLLEYRRFCELSCRVNVLRNVCIGQTQLG